MPVEAPNFNVVTISSQNPAPAAPAVQAETPAEPAAEVSASEDIPVTEAPAATVQDEIPASIDTSVEVSSSEEISASADGPEASAPEASRASSSAIGRAHV